MADLLERLQAALADRYRIEREIGSGGMAAVYLAEDLKHHRRVALKVLRPELTALLGPERFLREVEITGRLTHPHILPLYDSGEAGSFLYYTMPYVAGESLRERLEREKQLPINDALRITQEVADALDCAHRNEIVHRDLKPENILLEEGHAVVADFGIAKAIGTAGAEKLTASGVTIGTPAYMSPEQAMGGGDLDGRSDLYSLGCVLYEMLAGQPPFTGPTAESVVHQQMNAPAPDVQQLRPSVPEDLQRVLERTLAKAPADRYATAPAFRAAVASGLRTAEHEPVAGHEPEAVEPGPARVAHERLGVPGPSLGRPWLWPVGVAAAVVIVVGAWLLLGHAPALRASPTAIAVLPFSVFSNQDDNYLAEGMVDLLATTLDGAAGLRSVDPRSLIVHCKQHGLTEPGPEAVPAVASRFGAGLVVWGSIHRTGDRFRLTATLYASDDLSAPITREVVEGPAADIQPLVDELAIRLITAYTGKHPGSQFVPVATRTTSSPEALKHFLEGEQLLRRRRYDEAREAFGRAVREDTAFAIAWQRLGLAAGGTADIGALLESSARALRYAHRLPERERLRIQAWRDGITGEYRSSIAILRGMVTVYPDDADAWFQLGEWQFHFNRYMGQSPVEGRDELVRALDLDPGYSHGMHHLLELAAMEENLAKVDSLLAVFLPDADHGDSLVCLTMRAYLAGDREQQARMLAGLRGDFVASVYAYRAVATCVQDLHGAEQVARQIISDGPDVRQQRIRYLLLAPVLQGQGRWRDAVEAIREAGRGDTVRATWYDALWTATTAFLLRPAEVMAAQERLRALRRPLPRDTMISATSAYRIAGFMDMEPAVRAYLEGLLAARLGDQVSIQRAAARLDTMKLAGEARDMPVDFASTLRALVAYQDADVGEALRRMGEAPLKAWGFRPMPFLKRIYHRFLRAELLRAAGRHEEAIGWYAGIICAETRAEVSYLARAYLGSAHSLAALGRNAEAIEHYRKFIDLWKNCDPELRPMVDDAQARMERLLAATG